MKRVFGLLSVVLFTFTVTGTSSEPAAMLFFGSGLACLPEFDKKPRNKSKIIILHKQAYKLQKKGFAGLLSFFLIFFIP